MVKLARGVEIAVGVGVRVGVWVAVGDGVMDGVDVRVGVAVDDDVGVQSAATAVWVLAVRAAICSWLGPQPVRWINVSRSDR